ncbi:MAG: hypothetical protein AMXMBFR59_18580 [Rhodanobacteraceae bacterium]
MVLNEWAELRARPHQPSAKDMNPDCLTDVQRAARFFYLQRLSFGGKVASRTYGTSTTSPARCDGARLARHSMPPTCGWPAPRSNACPWQGCMARYDRENTLFFVDPPYYGLTGYGVKFGVEHYEQLAEVMTHAKVKVILTVNAPSHAAGFRALHDGVRSDQLHSRREQKPQASQGTCRAGRATSTADNLMGRWGIHDASCILGSLRGVIA